MYNQEHEPHVSPLSCRYSITDGAAEDLRVLAGLLWGVFIPLTDKEQRQVTEDPVSSVAQHPNSATDVLFDVLLISCKIINQSLIVNRSLILLTELDKMSAIKHTCVEEIDALIYLNPSRHALTSLYVSSVG